MTSKVTSGEPHRATSPATASPQPKKVLGLRDLVMFYVVTTLSLRWIPVAASAGPSTVVIWIIGLLTIFVPLAMCVRELSSRYPEEGGMYVWSKHAFGDFAAFLTGWVYWTSNLPYFPAVLYFAAGNALFIGGTRWQKLELSPLFFVCFSLAGIALALLLNVVGLNVGKWLNNVGAIGTWAPILLLWLVALLAWHRFGPATNFDPGSLKPTLSFGTIGVWATILYAFSGAEAASFMGGEIRSARQTIPRALMLAGALMTAGYIVSTAAILVALPQKQVSSLSGIMQAISVSSARAGFSGVGPVVALLICVANLGGVGAYLASLSRIPFVVGLDRYLPSAFARVHPRWGTPHIALVGQAIACGVFILLGQAGSSVRGAYQLLISMTIITNFIPYLFMFAALIRMQREPAEPGVMRVPGGKPVAIALAIVGFVTTCAVIAASVMPDPGEPNKMMAVAKIVVLTIVLLGGGVALYTAGKRRASKL